MIYIDEDPKAFAKKYGLKISTVVCSSCMMLVIRDIPFRTKDCVGLEMRDHPDCTYKSFVLTPITEEAITFFKSLLGENK